MEFDRSCWNLAVGKLSGYRERYVDAMVEGQSVYGLIPRTSPWESNAADWVGGFPKPETFEVECGHDHPSAILKLKLPLRPGKQQINRRSARGTTARERRSIPASAEEFPKSISMQRSMGSLRKLDGKRAPASGDYILKPRDRIEIYRPLRITPMEARHLRAARSGSKKKAPRA